MDKELKKALVRLYGTNVKSIPDVVWDMAIQEMVLWIAYGIPREEESTKKHR